MTWGTYRALNLSRDRFETWLRHYYKRMLLDTHLPFSNTSTNTSAQGTPPASAGLSDLLCRHDQ